MRPLRPSDGQRVELRAQGPHAVSMECGMQQREYFDWAHRYHARTDVAFAALNVKCHDTEMSLLEGLIASRGDRRLADAN